MAGAHRVRVAAASLATFYLPHKFGKRFTAMLPEALSDPWVADLPARLAAGCFGTFTDAEMQQAAAAIRRDPEGGTLFPGGQGSGQGRVLRLGHLQEDLA